MVTLEFPAFVRVTADALLFPIATVPKLILEELEVRNAVAAIPMPLKETVLGELEISLITETLPARTPAAFGEKTTLNVACFPAPITEGSEAREGAAGQNQRTPLSRTADSRLNSGTDRR